MRHLPAGLVVLLLAGAPAAAAGAPRSCPQLTDAAGDAWQPAEGSAVRRQRPELDVLSTTVWSDRASLTVVIRVAALAAAPLGERLMYSFYVNNSETSYIVEANRSLAGGDFFRLVGGDSGAVPATSGPGVTGAFDEARDEIRMSVPLRAIDASEGLTLRGITVDTWGLVEAGAAGYSVFTGSTVDRTSMGHTHVAGDRRCAR